MSATKVFWKQHRLFRLLLGVTGLSLINLSSTADAKRFSDLMAPVSESNYQSPKLSTDGEFFLVGGIYCDTPEKLIELVAGLQVLADEAEMKEAEIVDSARAMKENMQLSTIRLRIDRLFQTGECQLRAATSGVGGSVQQYTPESGVISVLSAVFGKMLYTHEIFVELTRKDKETLKNFTGTNGALKFFQKTKRKGQTEIVDSLTP